MRAALSLRVVLSVSILITRIATIALTHTGLSRETARFQARSAFTGAGFTTDEAESAVNHPVRRRMLMLLMLLGNAGIVTAISSMMLTFVGDLQMNAGDRLADQTLAALERLRGQRFVGLELLHERSLGLPARDAAPDELLGKQAVGHG